MSRGFAFSHVLLCKIFNVHCGSTSEIFSVARKGRKQVSTCGHKFSMLEKLLSTQSSLLGSAFPKPCYTQPDGCGNLAQRQSFASSIAAQGFENRSNCNQLPQPAQKNFSHRHTQQTADFCPLKSRKGNFPEAAPPNSQNNCPLQSERAKHWDKNGS